MLNSKEQETLAIVIGLAVVVVLLFSSGLFSFNLNKNNQTPVLDFDITQGASENIELGVERELFDGAVLVTDTVLGAGLPVLPGTIVTLHYIGGLSNGEIFDNSYDKGEPVSFLSGAGMIIPGVDGGIQGMMAGGKRTIVISPEFAYGDQQMGPIPPNSTLIFEVEIVGIEMPDTE